MADAAPDDDFRGITMPIGGQLRIGTITFNLETGETTTSGVEVRWDMWPKWLEVAEDERDLATAARAANPGPVDQEGFGASLISEMTHSMTSICASAFALEAFTNSVSHYLPHSVAPAPKKSKRPLGRAWAVIARPFRAAARKTSTATRIHGAWLKAFKVPNELSKASRITLGQMFHFRNQAVHSPAAFISPAMHPIWPVAIEPRYVMFRVENAVTAAEFTRGMIARLVANPRGQGDDWLEWCRAQAEKLNTAP